jgi:predicted methyltransferase
MTQELDRICKQVAENTRFQEGWQGVLAVLRMIHASAPVSTKDVASRLGYPIPLVSAIRRELEKARWLERKGGMVFSADALEVVSRHWGGVRDATSQAPDWIEPLDRYLEGICKDRPSATREWDQSHATRSTMAARASQLGFEVAFPGRRLVFLGDDDLTSLSVYYRLKLLRGLEVAQRLSITVLEIDPRLVDHLRSEAEKERFPLEVIHHDLREPLPERCRKGFDAFFTDPPYTPEGAELFLQRGRMALDPGGLRLGYLAIPLSPPTLQRAVQESLVHQDFLIDYLFPGLNQYEGASMQGGVSALYRLRWWGNPRDLDLTPYRGKLYTADKKSN